MKSKKLISLLCAAAMSASAFAGLTVTASAATDLFTFTDGSTTGWTMANGTVTQKSDDDGEYLELQGSGSGNRTATYSLGTSISGEYTIEYDTMMIRGNGMSRIMHTNQIAFTNDTDTKDTRDGAGIVDAVNEQQGTKYQSGAGSSIANAALKTDLRPYLTDKWMINDDATSELVAYPENAVNVADSKWVRVQAAVNDNKTTVTVIDKAGNKLVDGVEYTNSGNSINSIYVCSNRGDSGSGIIDLDNIHIYQGAPETLTTDGLRGDATVVVPTVAPVMPTPAVKTQAPGLTAPEGVTTVVNNTFSKALASTAMGETDTTITDVDGLSIAMKSRTGGDTGTTVSVADWAAGDKTLTLIGGPYSGAGRGPVVSAVDSLEVADGKSSVMTFAVNLGSNKGGGAGRLYILKDNSQAGEKKDGAYNNVMGVLTTDDTASSYTIGSGSNVVTIGQQVEAYEWYKVAVIVSSDKFRIWVAKADEDFTEKPQVDCDHVGTGETASSVTALPLLAVTSEKGGSYTGSVARIDNMLTYSGTADQPRKLLPTTEAAPTPAPIPAKVTMSVDETANTVTLTSDKDTNAVLVQASYRTDKTLDSVKKVVNVALTAGTAYTVPATDLDAFTTNDKIMVWDSLKTMTPLAGAYTYTVESNDYAIKKDGTLTVADSVVAENVTLAANAATTVEIANPSTGTTLAQGEEATYTATVKDQDGRVMTAAVDWTVVNSEDVAAENITVANGKVNVAEEATAGDYKVKATVNGTTVSATADLKVIAAEKLNLSITSQDAEQGTVAYTVNGVASTDTQLNKGKKIVATATPAALYEFVGWATSLENVIAATYVSTDAQYSFDLNANTTLIAVFKYTGIYYQNDYNNATESDWVSGNTGRYTVSIAGDDNNKYTQISAVATGNNGTSITSSAVQVDADKDYIAEFDLALTGGTNQTSSFAVKAKDSGKYALVLQLKTAGSTTWTVNGTDDVTLEKGVLYHYTIEKVETGVKVTIAPKAGGDAVVDGVTYTNDTATTGKFAGKVSNAGLAGMQFNTKRYYAGMQIDNVLVKAPATTSVTE